MIIVLLNDLPEPFHYTSYTDHPSTLLSSRLDKQLPTIRHSNPNRKDDRSKRCPANQILSPETILARLICLKRQTHHRRLVCACACLRSSKSIKQGTTTNRTRQKAYPHISAPDVEKTE